MNELIEGWLHYGVGVVVGVCIANPIKQLCKLRKPKKVIVGKVYEVVTHDGYYRTIWITSQEFTDRGVIYHGVSLYGHNVALSKDEILGRKNK